MLENRFIHSKLLLMHMEKHKGIVVEKGRSTKEKQKSYKKFMDVYELLLTPFLEGEKMKPRVLKGVEKERDTVVAQIGLGEDVTREVEWVMEHTKEILSTRKTSMDKVENKWK